MSRLTRTERLALQWFADLPGGICIGNVVTELAKAIDVDHGHAAQIIDDLQEYGCIAQIEEGPMQ